MASMGGEGREGGGQGALIHTGHFKCPELWAFMFEKRAGGIIKGRVGQSVFSLPDPGS